MWLTKQTEGTLSTVKLLETNKTLLKFTGATSTPRPRLRPRGCREKAATRRPLPDGGALQTVYLLVELGNDAVEFRDAFLVPKCRSLLDVLMLSHEVGLLTLKLRE